MPGDAVQQTILQTGYQNKWSRKPDKDLNAVPQLKWDSPLLSDPTVAIIGGGLSGLMCASQLAERGVHSVVFDTGEHGPGGRLASRSTSDGSLHPDWLPAGLRVDGLLFDHAAQFFTCTDARFQRHVDAWVARGWVRVWDGLVGNLRAGAFTPAATGFARYVAVGGMRQLATHLANSLTQTPQQLQQQQAGSRATAGSSSGGAPLVQMRRPVWVNQMTSESDRGWLLTAKGRKQGVFDAVVIAHNGKCANRLMMRTGAPRVTQQLMRLRLSAVWVLTVLFEAAVPTPVPGVQGAFVQGGDGNLSWVANNSAKLQLPHGPAEAWTLISTDAYGQRNKVPQEAVPPAVQEQVARDLLASFRVALGSPECLPPVLFTRCQLWGAALPLNTPGVDCILDPCSRVGVCGDWLSGSSMQAAAVSGMALGDQLSALRGVPMTDQALAPFTLGLTQRLQPVAGGSEIGQFPRAQLSAPAHRQRDGAADAQTGARDGGGEGAAKAVKAESLVQLVQ